MIDDGSVSGRLQSLSSEFGEHYMRRFLVSVHQFDSNADVPRSARSTRHVHAFRVDEQRVSEKRKEIARKEEKKMFGKKYSFSRKGKERLNIKYDREKIGNEFFRIKKPKKNSRIRHVDSVVIFRIEFLNDPRGRNALLECSQRTQLRVEAVRDVFAAAAWKNIVQKHLERYGSSIYFASSFSE